MAPVYFLCKVLKPNARFGIHVLQLDSGINYLKHGGSFCRRSWDSVNSALRHHSTKIDTQVPGSRGKYRSKKKAVVDIIRVKEESVSEGKAKVTRLTQHSIDETLGILPRAAAQKLPSPECNPVAGSLCREGEKLGEEVSLERFSHLLRNDYEKGLFSVRNASEVVRWNTGLMHTYDANFFTVDGVRGYGELICHTFLENGKLDAVSNETKVLSTEAIQSDSSDLGILSAPGDLSALTSPLSGFAHIESTVDEKPHPATTNSVSPKPKKKKVVSSKKKTASKTSSTKAEKKEKFVSGNKQRSENILENNFTDELLEMEHISLGIESSRVDDSIIEGLNDSLTQDQAKLSGKGKKGKGMSAAGLKKKLRREQHLRNIADMKKQCREVVFNQTLEAYLSVCVNVGLLNRALHTLLYYRQLAALGSSRKISSIKPYNVIFHGLAAKGSFGKMKELQSLLEQDMIPMNEESYAAFLSVLGRQLVSYNNQMEIRGILDLMENNNVELDALFNKVKYVNDNRETVLHAIRRIIPSYVPKKTDIDHTYSCELLNNLNGSTHTSKVRPPLAGLASQQDLWKWTKEQFACETAGEVTIPSIEKKENSKDVAYFREKLARWETKWKEALHSDFITKVEAMKSNFSSPRHNKEINLYPYLVCLPPEDFVNILMQEIHSYASGSEGYSLSRYSLYRGIGERVYHRYLTHYKKDAGVLNKLKHVYKSYGSWMLEDCHGDGNTYVPRIQWNELAKDDLNGSQLEHNIVEWPNNILLAVGRFLYSLLLRNVMVWKPLHSEKHVYPAFYEVDRSYDYKLIEEFKPAPVLMEIYRRAARPTLTFPSYVAPMVCPPVPWTSPKSGGYLISESHIIRLPASAQQQKRRMEEVGVKQIYPVMDSLNQLGAVPWRVNKPMLDLMIDIFNNKGWSELDIPPPVSECPVPPKMKSSMTSAEKKQIQRQRMEYNKKKSEMFSLWCDALYKFSFANHFRDRIIWFPHNMDFRGRVYPLPPHINHMSSDVFRSLLIFARGEKLGDRGLRWLKLHLINLTGFVKREAVEDRLKYCESVMDEIFDSADNPMTGNRWWTKSDEPWQTLAACKELAAAIRSSNPEEYISHLPIHQDGSCNGLQHYAALGRDEAGAISVNLAPSRVPQDVYSAVAELVEQERCKDAKEGKEIALMLDGFVHRKVIKQTVMTTVYGVTKFGARLQIERQLKDLNFPPHKTWAGSQYLASKTFLSLEQMFTSAKEIQDWFTDCARLVSKTCRQNIEWVTPLGLPVVQHYTVNFNEKCPTAKMGVTINIDFVMQPNTMKQKNAFPPNFIHSLDSSHMMLTSIYCQSSDLTFISVHDCFWTHASTVDVMNKICREQFVALHSEPILENLSEYMKNQFSFDYKDFTHDGSARDNAKMKVNTLLCNVPRKGNFNIERVLDSVYFFS